MTGLHALAGLPRERPIILVTAHGDIQTSVIAMKAGAVDLRRSLSTMSDRARVKRPRKRIDHGGCGPQCDTKSAVAASGTGLGNAN